MRNVICCWNDRNPSHFESHVPLLFSGRRNLALGFSNEIDLLFLNGLDLLGERYKEQLEEVGYRLHDVSDLYAGTADRYAALCAFGGYEMKCFLRWPVIASYFRGDRIIHYDGDIVFNEDPAVIGVLLQGSTFVLQGCPAVTCISDLDWFSRYQEQLDLLVENPEGYSARAWKERDGWRVSETQKWAGQRSREVISSDQDLISHLIHTDRIPQDRPAQLAPLLGSYAVFENPLYLHGCTFNDFPDPIGYERRSGIDYVGGKRVLTWHMQSDFNLYLSTFLFRKRFMPWVGGRLANHLVEPTFPYRLGSLFSRLCGGYTRLDVYRYFFERHDFGEVFADRTWWDRGAFR
ncbi:hypothetical protein KP004_07860 [Geomonas oryzisoli]|uniref:Glycosyl transferase n=1 Tax=Geomonas oryzisoli TaxID=2847992 RepID=A0ABX8JEG3_9BACT|nr:hypothetical protein [Geomonas oryzisoli]QWV95082.1 hypothetical protein KP004_07860 [Geomonas oryzisoli]